MNTKKIVSQDLLVVFFLVAMVLWFCHEMIGTSQIPFFRDLGPYFYPMRFSLAQSFGAGELPLWDRHMAMGFPLLANFQSGAFYPPNLFFLLLPFVNAVQAVFIFHYFVAATGGYSLLRQWRYPPYLALIGAILFTFSGMTVSLSNLLNHFQAAVWLPWVILFWERWFCSGSQRAFLAATLVSLIQLLAGSPEVYMMSVGLLVLDGLRLKREIRNLTYRQLLIRFFLSHGLVFGLAMVQILPTVELFMESRGRKIVSYGESVRWSLHPLSLINLFFLDKEVDPNRFDGLRLFFSSEVPLMISLYLGVISLFGICLSFVKAGLREKGILLVLLTFSTVISMGKNTPVHPFLFRYIPFLDLIRYPEKFFFLIHIFLLFMTLRGLLTFLQSREDFLGRHGLLLLSIPLAFLFIYFLFRYERGSLIEFITLKKTTSPILNHMLERFSLILVHLERQVALTFAICLLLFLWKKEKVRESLAQTLLVALVFFDLSSAHRPYQFFLDAGFVNESPKVIKRPDPYRLMYIPNPTHLHPDFYPSIKESFGQGMATVYANLLPNTGVFHGFDYLQDIDALRRWFYDLFIQTARNLPPERLYHLLAALNVKYIIAFQPFPPGRGMRLTQHLAEYGSYLYELEGVVPRVYIVSRTSVEETGLEVLKQLSMDQFDPLKEVILDRSLSMPAQKDFRAQAKIMRYGNKEVLIRASLSSPGVLVLTDSFYPGWRVYVDGKEKEILRANFFFRAVPLSAGEYLVEFRYRPRSFAAGLALSIITGAGLALWSICISIRGRCSLA